MFLKVDNHFVKFYAAGTGYGESIIINISNKILIGIDSSSKALIATKDQLSILDELWEIDFEEKIWIFTHYHYDHIQGGYTLLKHFWDKFDQVILPFEYSKADIAGLIQLHAESKGKSYGWRARKEYLDFRKATNKGEGKISNHNGPALLTKEILVDKKDNIAQFELRMEGADEGLKRKILERNLNDLKEKEKLSTSRKDCNTTSSILHLKYGNFEALLLADAPIERFEDRDDFAKISLFKVSHHGSETGSSRELLEKMTQNKTRSDEPIAIITPYSPSKLPTIEMINLYNEFNFKLIKTDQITTDQFKDEIESSLNELLKIEVVSSSVPKTQYVTINYQDKNILQINS